jgi:anaerobic selenocysteine-containing dehydrogenase
VLRKEGEMNITRRTFLKGAATSGGAAVAGKLLLGPLDSLSASSVTEVSAVEPSSTQAAEEWIASACWIGKQDCGLLARRVNGRVVKLEGHPGHPLNLGTLCPKGVAQISALYDPNRVRTPLIRTNAKGEPGTFRAATWDEALALVADRIKAARSKNPKSVVWQKGRSKSKSIYDKALVAALGAEKLHHGAFCSDAGYRACEYTVGLNGVLNPDYKFVELIIHWGFDLTNAGGNKLCWITYPRQFLEAKARGAKVITIDPRLHAGGPHAGEWVPIRPGTDIALALAICNELIRIGAIDREYLINYTNAPFLVGEDGMILRENQLELVWDASVNRPTPVNEAGSPALEGVYQVDGRPARTAFQLFKEQVASMTPERAAEICGISPKQISGIAKEIAEAAQIGATKVVDGVRLPFRPVGIHTYHMVQQERGFQLARAMLMISMLIGSVGAVGGQLIDLTWKIHPDFDKFGQLKISEPPYNVWLENSKYFPMNSNNSAIVSQVLQDPDRYGVSTLPEVMIIHMANPVISFGSQRDIIEGFKKIPFIVVIDPWLSKTADLLADVVLPAATLEKYEGPLSAGDQYTDAISLRTPVMEPLGDSKGEVDIYLDLCEAVGVLTGPSGFLAKLNDELGLKGEHALDTSKKPTVREIFDKWAKSQGVEGGVAYFETKGPYVKGPIPATKRYGYALSPPFGGIRHRFYGESLVKAKQTMERLGVDKHYSADYTPFPEWRPPTMEESPEEYDLYLVTFKLIEFKQGRGTQLPLVAELAPAQRLWMHPSAAAARNLRDGDVAEVTSYNAVTRETKKIRVRVMLTEGIRPDTVGLPHHYGNVAVHPWCENQGPAAGELLFTGPGYVSNTADQSFQVKVSVKKA